jgi:Kelch motif protein
MHRKGFAPMPDAVSSVSAVYYPPTNKIYIFGGSGGISNATRIYDIASDTWTAGASMPGGRSERYRGLKRDHIARRIHRE